MMKFEFHYNQLNLYYTFILAVHKNVPGPVHLENVLNEIILKPIIMDLTDEL